MVMVFKYVLLKALSAYARLSFRKHSFSAKLDISPVRLEAIFIDLSDPESRA